MKPAFPLLNSAAGLLLLPLLFIATHSFSQALPVPSHVVVIIFENEGDSEIIGTSYAPHINAFTTDTNAAIFTQSFAIEHPSQPNYLDFFSGSNQGVTDDNLPTGIPYTTAN